jgi:RNA ligase (TIGR02306 family)
MAFFGVTIEEIETVGPIDGADRIQVATVKGLSFTFVIGKDTFKPGDKVLYFPVDSIVPEKVAGALGVFGKLAGKNKDRIKTVKLKGVLSQGIVGKIDLIDGLTDRSPEGITAFFGVTKYEPPEVVCNGGKLTRHAAGVETYDIEGADRYPLVVDALMDQIVYITEKVEGSNWYGGVDENGTYVVGQRSGAIIPDDPAAPTHTWWTVAAEQGILAATRDLYDTVFQNKSVIVRGEMTGGSIQGNLYKFPKFSIFAFDILVDGKYLDATEFLRVAAACGIKTAPVISKDKTLRDWLNGRSIKGASHGNSLLGDIFREGIVIKPLTEQPCKWLPANRLMIKQRDPIYLDKYGF